MNDGDGLTFFLTKEKGAFVTLDLGKPEKIEKIVYMPRNDDNFIRLGDQYELFYQDGFRGWISLGRQVASELTLHYDNILKKRNVLKRFYLFRSPIKKNYKKYWIIIKMTA